MEGYDLIKLQHFFEVDTRTKREMYRIAPPLNNGYLDDEYLCKYTNSLEEGLNYIFCELKCVALDIFGDDDSVLRKIEKLEKDAKKSFYSSGLDISRLKNFYKIFISNMEFAFVNKVKNSCIGYTAFYDFPISSANSVNEILHLIHSYVVNNDQILQSMPVIAEKTNSKGYLIQFRGEDSEFFHQLFDEVPSDLNVGWTDMVALSEKKLIMMVRDRGHALTIEITLAGDKAKIEYFVPKICNVDMVNALPGVNKVKDTSIGTTGIFEVEKDTLSESLFDFISKVPDDSDMISFRQMIA